MIEIRCFSMRLEITPSLRVLALFLSLLLWYDLIRRNATPSTFHSPQMEQSTCLDSTLELSQRFVTARLTDFGAVGDGRTLNTGAFDRAMAQFQRYGERGGAQLIIPAGDWLTGCFNLTSHVTLYLERGATILASQDTQDWPLTSPLVSYGRGRERPGRRHSSLLQGENLVDVLITGENGTIDGQGSIWWEMWRNRTLQHTRGHIVEFVRSEKIIISNVVLRNSPFWTVHPVYCNNVVIKNVTILAPFNAPNTDGIDPDSSSNVCIEDCYISNGDDLIAIKSGWDEYGINERMASSNITIRRVTGTTPTCSGIAFGSEISGGISNVTVQDMRVFNAAAGIRLKTVPGRGGHIINITISGMVLKNVKRAIEFSGDAGEHPDEKYNRSAFSVVKGIVVKDLTGDQIQHPGRFVSVPEAPFLDVCLFNISLNLSSERSVRSWTCSYVHGSSYFVSPTPCKELQERPGNVHDIRSCLV